MFVVRSYTVLHLLMVEVTCWHGQEHEASHLIYREGVETSGEALALLEALSDVVARCHDHAYRGDLELTDECGL